MVTAKKLLSINRLHRTAEQLLKTIELAATAQQIADSEPEGNLWTPEERELFRDRTVILSQIRADIAKLANDHRERLDAQKAASERNRRLSEDLGARAC